MPVIIRAKAAIIRKVMPARRNEPIKKMPTTRLNQQILPEKKLKNNNS